MPARFMLLPADDLQANLNRLRKSLASVRCCAPTDAHEANARDTADKMPLSHTTSETTFDKVLESGALLSADRLGIGSRGVDIDLKGTNEICFYLGSAAFPENEFGFLFSPHLTVQYQDEASATPFDSGGCKTRFKLPGGRTDWLKYVGEHSMPVPGCRDYLGDLLVSHFQDTSAYLAGRPFTCPVCGTAHMDPHGITLDSRSRTYSEDKTHALFRMHEVRIQGRVDLQHPLLVAVLVPEGMEPPQLAPLIVAGVKLVSYDKDSAGVDGTGALRRASVDYILDHLLN